MANGAKFLRHLLYMTTAVTPGKQCGKSREKAFFYEIQIYICLCVFCRVVQEREFKRFAECEKYV